MKGGGMFVLGLVSGALLSLVGAEKVVAGGFTILYVAMAVFVLRGLAWGFTRLQLRGRNR